MIDTADPLVEPTETKLAVWESAVDLAVRRLRIDERLLATDLEKGTDGETDGEAAALGE